MTISLFLDVTIAVLLIFTITYAVRLNGRLSHLRKDKAELQGLAKTFAEATVRAEEAAGKLKVSTDALKAEVEKAEVLKDDLAYLVERGGSTADEMLERVRSARTSSSAPAAFNKGGFSDEDLAGAPGGETLGSGFSATASNAEEEDLLRQAIGHLVNRPEITQKVFLNQVVKLALDIESSSSPRAVCQSCCRSMILQGLNYKTVPDLL